MSTWRTRPADGVFQDTGEIVHLLPPNCVIKAAEITQRKIMSNGDEFAAGIQREVLWCPLNGAAADRRALELIFYIHPAGAAAVTIATVAYDANNVATVTRTKLGHLLNEAGALVAATEEAEDVAGLLLPDYYYHVVDSQETTGTHETLVISEGDGLWLVRAGNVQVYSTTDSVNDALFISSATVAGQIDPAVAPNTGGTIGQFYTGLMQNLLGRANPRAYGLGIFTATAVVGAGLKEARLLLPKRFNRTNA